jgi:hypothetical protein
MVIDRYALTIIAVCLLWLSLGGHQLLSLAHAQPQTGKPLPTVVQGSDFGYRVDRLRKGDAPIGTLVVRIDGTWYEARLDYLK